MSRPSTYMALYLYLSFISLKHTHGSALQGLKLSCSMMSWILCDHLKPELFKPYGALWITSICSSSSSNSEPATMYSFSFVVVSRYALPMSAPRLSCCSIWLGILIALGILLKLLQNRCYLLDQELGDHLLLICLCDIHCVYMQGPGVP